ncbi:acyl-CoA dehydrogenase family protein [Palleronia sp.]|uniref:acyl-CoA dehydrogenase family protein n=1 Tax=Palleronia sp. TaxID=1940284 RepID=UPI0035C86503
MSDDQVRRTLALLERTPGAKDVDPETAAAILEAARALADDAFAPYGARADREGARMQDGRVRLPPGSRELWRAYAESGWLGLDLPERYGGSELPLVLQAAMLPLFERHATAFMMGPGAARAAAHLLAARAGAALSDEWVPKLVAGEWGATICISEPGAGSDVGRLCTRAQQQGGTWRITGEKIWISFGDHDAVDRIGHCLLARTEEVPGTRGLSLFLVPDRIGAARNGVTVTRIEDKLGMHASPTCAMSFEGAQGWLIGERGRGLAQLFHMIELMRLQTGCQGLGLATMATECAEAYAAERLQGGPPDAPPVPISHHAGVAARLARMRARTEILRAASLEIACAVEAGRGGGRAAQAFGGWMLPMFKSFGGEAGFEVADAAIQTLGGAGYTRDRPVERALRDARVLTIYEGTTDIQALTLLTRMLWADRSGLDAFLARVETCDGLHADVARTAARELADLSHALAERKGDTAALACAEPYMRQAWCAVSAWLADRIDPDEAAPFLADLPERMALNRARCMV